MVRRFVLYAPNVHTGGGLVLLRALLSASRRPTPLTAFLDARARGELVLPEGAKVSWVVPTLPGRLKAEFKLRKSAGGGDIVLCFHGLPPQLPSSARVIVFLQNRLYVAPIALSQFRWKTRLRLVFERAVSRSFRHRVSEYLVQTPSMQRAVIHWYGVSKATESPKIKVLPFLDAIPLPSKWAQPQPEWDFVYVASGEAHKNHRILFEAWRLLAQEGLRPSLALTLGAKDKARIEEVEAACATHALRIHDLGQLGWDDVMALYAKARALIFPSASESFGLPLIEAAYVGLPILAPELDYVRDVCNPTQTFDPASPVSIARAVKRFLGRLDPTVTLRTPSEFWDELLR